ncbi:MAG: hypothetical protein V2I43_14085 [Parvularcula sp.]|nr:hypothetical protein [Parvularcula sp.]
MTHTLFLSETITVFQPSDGSDCETAPSILDRKGKFTAEADEQLQQFGVEGSVVACLPPRMTSCQNFRVATSLGRAVTHTDLSDGLAAASRKAGGSEYAVISAEPSVVSLDDAPIEGSPIGRYADRFAMEVTAFISPLRELARLEKLCGAVGLKLEGVMATEEAVGAAMTAGPTQRPPLILCDRWTTTVLSFAVDGVARSASVPVGYGHLALDLELTFKLETGEAEAMVKALLLDRQTGNTGEERHVLSARLEEIASRTNDAVRLCQENSPEQGRSAPFFLLLGLPTSPRVVSAFKEKGLTVRAPRGDIKKTDPWPLAIADGAVLIAQGAVPRTAATALHLDAPDHKDGPLQWLLRHF